MPLSRRVANFLVAEAAALREWAVGPSPQPDRGSALAPRPRRVGGRPRRRARRRSLHQRLRATRRAAPRAWGSRSHLSSRPPRAGPPRSPRSDRLRQVAGPAAPLSPAAYPRGTRFIRLRVALWADRPRYWKG